jgi:hypothetical protein
MPFLTSPLIYVIAFLLATNIIAGIGWKVSAASAEAEKQKVVACQAEHKAFVEQTEALGEIAKAKAKIKERQNAQNAEDTSNSWAAALKVVRADYSKRLRDATRRSAGGSGVSAPSPDRPGDAQAGSDTVPSPARVAADCAETTITLNYLQSYVERLQND